MAGEIVAGRGLLISATGTGFSGKNQQGKKTIQPFTRVKWAKYWKRGNQESGSGMRQQELGIAENFTTAPFKICNA